MMQDDIQSVLISQEELADAVQKLGERISKDYEGDVYKRQDPDGSR